MTKENAEISAKAQKTAEVVSNWVLGGLFALLMLGLADPLANGLLMWIGHSELNMFERFILDLVGPVNLAEQMRRSDFLLFVFFSASVSFFASLISFGLIYFAIRYGDQPKNESAETTE